MPEPITIASAVSAIVANGIKLCLGVYGTIDGMKQAPNHLKAVSSDLKDFYSILGTIQWYLDDKELTQGACYTPNRVTTSKDFDKIVSGYIKAGQKSSVTGWQKVSWTWKIANVENLRRHLSDHKASLSVAIGMANLINNTAARQTSTSRNATDIQEPREISVSQLADEKAQIVALVTKLSRLKEKMHDSSVIMKNQRATIRAFASDAESILTCSLPEPTWSPSLQVSTLVADSTRSASFVTAWTTAAHPPTPKNTKADPAATFAWLKENLTTIYQTGRNTSPFQDRPLTLSRRAYLNMYTTAYDYCYSTECTPSNPYGLTGGYLYRCLVEVIRGHCSQVRASLLSFSKEPTAATEMIQEYLAQWNMLTQHLAPLVTHILGNLEKHYVQRWLKEKRIDVYLIQDLHTVVWKEEIFLRVSEDSTTATELGRAVGTLLQEQSQDGSEGDGRELAERFLDSLGSIGVDLEEDPTTSSQPDEIHHCSQSPINQGIASLDNDALQEAAYLNFVAALGEEASQFSGP